MYQRLYAVAGEAEWKAVTDVKMKTQESASERVRHFQFLVATLILSNNLKTY